jgi:hypothetical protein
MHITIVSVSYLTSRLNSEKNTLIHRLFNDAVSSIEGYEAKNHHKTSKNKDFEGGGQTRFQGIILVFSMIP